MFFLDNITITEENLPQIDIEKYPNMRRFVISPLPKGFGYTIANTLRRVLLSSIPGTGITSLRINDLPHEFTTIPGIKQNVLHLVLGLKNIKFKLNGDQTSFQISLNAKEVGPVTAGQFKVDGNLEIVNKDLVIAEITDKKTKLNIEAIVEKGIGYKDKNDSLRDEIGRIPLDVDFSPIKLVRYSVDSTRYGDIMNLDKITLDINSDGSIEADEALKIAITELKDLYTSLEALSKNVISNLTKSEN